MELIQGDEALGDIFIVVHSSRIEGTDFAYKIGADGFLPIPFKNEQIDAIFRQVFNKPKKILLVGESAANNDLLHKELTNKGFIIDFASTGSEGFEALQTIFPDLVILDHNLIDISSFDFMKFFNDNLLIKHIPIVILSPTQKIEVIEEYFDLGALDILFPPFNAENNINKIANITSPPKKGRHERVLVVDDSPVTRNILSKMFKKMGFIVNTASDGKEALALIEKEKPDIITSDYEMPVMDGWDFCSSLNNNSSTKDIPVIMITKKKGEIDFKKGELLGVDGYLPKPLKLQELEKHVKIVMAEAKARKERLAISKYVAADAIKNVGEVIEGIKSKEPEDKYITILFSDICSFTRKCEQIKAKDIVPLLNEYFDIMIDVLHENNAIIDKIIGDAIIARFNSNDRKTDAFNACKSALDMLKKLEEFNKNSFESFDIRIGINSGNVILGNIGSEKYRLDYTMIGDSMNVAKRLENNATKNGCLISSYTYELIKDMVTIGEGKNHVVKGKLFPVKAYELLKIDSTPDI